MNPSPVELVEPKRSAAGTKQREYVNVPTVPPRKSGPALTVAIVLVVATVLGLGFWNLSRRLAPEAGTSTSAESAYVASFPEKTIAVLPFKDLSETKQDAFLADSLQDDILTTLSKVGDLRVISATSVSTYSPEKSRNLREIAQSLGAAYLLEGTVRRYGDKASVNVALTDARRNIGSWTQSYDREIADIFGMQGDIVQQIASRMQANLSAKERAAIEERPTNDATVYGLYLRAKTIIASSYNAQLNKLLQAVQLLDQAIARDPNFYLAYCQLGAAHNYLYFFGLDHTPARLAQAEAALNTITRLRPEAGETHLAKATFLYRCYLDYDHARAELALARSALPSNSETFELTGYIDRREGLWTESARSLQKAFELDPRNSFLLQQIASSYQELRQYKAMAAALDRSLTLVPRDLDTRITRAFVDVEWRADTRPLHDTIQNLLRENPTSATDMADQWLYVSLCERDPAAAAQALAAIPASGISSDLNFPHQWCEALVARLKGDESGAHGAFLAARAETEKIVREQPNYGPALCVLGLIDAALGRKEEAMSEGRRAVEMLPTTKDSIDGAEIMKYLCLIYTWCGEKDRALEQIAATLRIPSTLSYGNLKLHPNWDSLRGDSRFEKIVADLAPKNSERD